MGFQRFLGFFLFLMMGFVFGCSNGYKFYVGGKDGWVLNPSENYTQWAHRNRFQVNDTLFFKYKKGSDSVLVVKKEDFDSCNAKSPIQSLTDGDSMFNLDHSGPFYFISGNFDNCNKGQKLHVIVMAVRSKSPSSPPPLAAAPPPMLPSISQSPADSPRDSSPDSSNPIVTPPAHSGSHGLNGFVSGSVLGGCIGLGLILG